MVVYREVEITVLSAHNLRNVRRGGFGTMSPHAVLWIDSNSKAATPAAERGGTNPTWNRTVRMLCRDALFGTAAKSKLVIQIFDKKTLVGIADVPLAQLQSKSKLEVRRLRKGSNFMEKVVGSIDIEVRVARVADFFADSAHHVVYNGVAVRGTDRVVADFHAFNEVVPGPVMDEKDLLVYHYQHLYVKKPLATWRGIRDNVHPERLGVLALGIGIGF